MNCPRCSQSQVVCPCSPGELYSFYTSLPKPASEPPRVESRLPTTQAETPVSTPDEPTPEELKWLANVAAAFADNEKLLRDCEQQEQRHAAEIEVFNREASARDERVILLRKPKVHESNRVVTRAESEEIRAILQKMEHNERRLARFLNDMRGVHWDFENLAQFYAHRLVGLRLGERANAIFYDESASEALSQDKIEQFRELFADQVSAGLFTFSVDDFLAEYKLTEVQFLPIAIEVLREAVRKTASEANEGVNRGSETSDSETSNFAKEIEEMKAVLQWARIESDGPSVRYDGLLWRLAKCVFNPAHEYAFVRIDADRKSSYSCDDPACTGKGWNEFIALLKQRNSTEGRVKEIEEEQRRVEEPDLPDGLENFPPFPRLFGVLHELATVIAPSLAYEQKSLALLTAIGLSISGRVRLASDPWLQPRLFSCSIAPPGQTKSAADREVRRALWPEPAKQSIDDTEPLYPHPPIEGPAVTVEFSANSGPALIQLLSQSPRILLAPDEISGLFEKARSTSNSPNTLMSELLRLYEGNETGRAVVSRRGEKNAHLKLTDVHLAIFGGATPQGFEKMWRGTGGDGAGLQSRFTLAYSDCPLPPFQTLTDQSQLARLVPVLNDRLRSVPGMVTLSSEAQALVIEWHDQHKDNLPPRVLDTAKRVSMILAACLERHEITARVMTWGLEFAEYQLKLKERLMPKDADSAVQQFEHKILSVFERHHQATVSQVRRSVHPDRHPGGHEAYNRALSALIRSGQIIITSKTPSGTLIYKEA